MNGEPTLERIARGSGLALSAAGPWIALHAAALEEIVTDAEKLGGSRPNIFIDVSQISRLDTFGAWLIERLRRFAPFRKPNRLSHAAAEAVVNHHTVVLAHARRRLGPALKMFARERTDDEPAAALQSGNCLAQRYAADDGSESHAW